MEDKGQPTSYEVNSGDNSVVNEYPEISPQITEYVKKEVTKTVKKVVEKKVNQELVHDKATLFTVFGIFASIVTFTSIEIQILKNTCSSSKITGLSLTILSSLLLFIFVLDYIGRSWREDFCYQLKKFPWHLLIIVSVIFVLGIFLSTKGNEQSCIEHYIYSRYEKNFIEKQVILENSLQSAIADLKKSIDKNNFDIEKLKNGYSKQ